MDGYGQSGEDLRAEDEFYKGQAKLLAKLPKPPEPYTLEDLADAVDEAAEGLDEHLLTDAERATGHTTSTYRVAQMAVVYLRQLQEFLNART